MEQEWLPQRQRRKSEDETWLDAIFYPSESSGEGEEKSYLPEDKPYQNIIRIIEEVRNKYLTEDENHLFDLYRRVNYSIWRVAKINNWSETPAKKKIVLLMKLIRMYCWRMECDEEVERILCCALTLQDDVLVHALEARKCRKEVGRLLSCSTGTISRRVDRLSKSLRMSCWKSSLAKGYLSFLSEVVHGNFEIKKGE